MKVILLLFSLVSSIAYGRTIPAHFKATSWSIEEHEDFGSEVDRESFYSLVDDIFSLYKKNDMSRNMEVGVIDWSVPYFSAWALEVEGAFSINFWGGFARIPSMTKKAFALTICHEIGHILGGEPFHLIEDSKNMSAEGQSDYFAASRCMKKYLSSKEHFEVVDNLSPFAASKCFEKYQESYSGLMCEYIAKAGQDLANVLGFLHKDQIFSYETPSELVVERTLHNSYPTIQCRLDTFLAGALADYPVQDLSTLRPACWFNSNN